MEKERPLCSQCQTRKVRNKGYHRSGNKAFGNKCYKCHDPNLSKYTRHRRAYCKLKRSIQLQDMNCSRCPFKPEHMCQIDVDHIDGNHSNNHPDNLQLLCANCHRLKTVENKDYLSYKEKTIE